MCLFLLKPGWHLSLEHSFRATGEVTQWGGEDKRIGARSSDTLRPVVAGTLRYSPKPSVRLVPHHPHSLTFLNVKSFTCAMLRGQGNWAAPLSGQRLVWYSLFPPLSSLIHHLGARKGKTINDDVNSVLLFLGYCALARQYEEKIPKHGRPKYRLGQSCGSANYRTVTTCRGRRWKFSAPMQ